MKTSTTKTASKKAPRKAKQSTSTSGSKSKPDSITIQAINFLDEPVRIKANKTETLVSNRLKGPWRTDKSFEQALPELIAKRHFRITTDKALNAYVKFFGRSSQEPATEAENQEDAPAPTNQVASSSPAARIPRCQVILPGEAEPQAIPADLELAPGMKLLRIFREELIVVEVEAIGRYLCQGETFPTLTHISWEVAGYQISGNSFFGLAIKHRKNN